MFFTTGPWNFSVLAFVSLERDTAENASVECLEYGSSAVFDLLLEVHMTLI